MENIYEEYKGYEEGYKERLNKIKDIFKIDLKIVELMKKYFLFLSFAWLFLFAFQGALAIMQPFDAFTGIYLLLAGFSIYGCTHTMSKYWGYKKETWATKSKIRQMKPNRLPK